MIVWRKCLCKKERFECFSKENALAWSLGWVGWSGLVLLAFLRLGQLVKRRKLDEVNFFFFGTLYIYIVEYQS